MDIYIKPAKKAALSSRNKVLIQDISEIVATADVTEKVKKMKLFDITADSKNNYLVSVTDIIRVIKKTYPDATVNNVGEMDTVIDFKPEKSRDNQLFKWIKIAIVSLILLAGSATAIMTFHTDAQMVKVFERYHEIFFGTKKESPWIIDIPYSIGLGVGIIVFFNHFMGKKVTDDPTPIEVEISLYEDEVTNTMIDILNTEKIRQDEKGVGVDVKSD